ncbi:hypothetical protein [Flavobacterium sp.]|uniref:hypothetical protein n=1 Tax=Flavobacterium sp. TaxID=239 RepID=UPI0037C12534
MKKIITLSLLLYVTILTAQNSSTLVIDNISNQFTNISLPYWLKSGQTIDLGTNAKSVSIIEFTVNGIALEFSQVISLTSSQTVPANKVWKIEAIGQTIATNSNPSNSNIPSNNNGISSSNNNSLPTIYQTPVNFNDPGVYTWTVPSGITNICIDIWGSGGSSGGGNGGGAGAFGYQCFNVVPLQILTITVGTEGSLSKVVDSNGINLIEAGGGSSSGIGGTSSATVNYSGQNGSEFNGGAAKFGGNGGIYVGQASCISCPGLSPGGGASRRYPGAPFAPAQSYIGGNGRVIIYM